MYLKVLRRLLDKDSDALRCRRYVEINHHQMFFISNDQHCWSRQISPINCVNTQATQIQQINTTSMPKESSFIQAVQIANFGTPKSRVLAQFDWGILVLPVVIHILLAFLVWNLRIQRNWRFIWWVVKMHSTVIL